MRNDSTSGTRSRDGTKTLVTRVPLVLASRSPRRRRLLRQLGLEFEVRASDVDERSAAETPEEMVQSVAERKRDAVAPAFREALVLAADTCVVLDGVILGKPENESGAADMLRRMSGRTHDVYTGIALSHPASNRRVTHVEKTEVTFGDLTDDEIAAYVASGSPMDKAGAYGIQDDFGAVFVKEIRGDYCNVVGLPLFALYRLLKTHFADLLL